MTQSELLLEYYKVVEIEKNKVKEEIYNLFVEHSDKEHFLPMFKEESQNLIAYFGRTYNMTAPTGVIGNPVLERKSFSETIKIYLDLANYPKELLESLGENKSQNPSNRENLL